MKKIITIIAVFLIFIACKKQRNPELQPLDLNISTNYASIDIGKKLPLNAITVQITNVNTNVTKTLETNAKGEVSFEEIASGIYDISASITISPADYTRLTGEIVNKSVIFNASDKNKAISSNNASKIELKLVSGVIGEWVIKQVYYAGSNTTTGATFRDQFIEIYNNTDQTLYADSLFIGEVIGFQNYTATNHYRTANGQYDWSKSVNMPTNIDANNDYVYPRALFMIPGTGKQYPVLPGKSIVIAQTAINHKAPFTGSDGKTITVRDPSLTIDLSGADFEAYYAPFLPRPLASDIDNPSVPNLDVLAYNGTDMILDNLGRTGFIVFRGDGLTAIKDLPQYNFPSIAIPTSTADKYFQIPIKLVIDAAEMQPNTAAARVPKKLGASLDAGYTFAPSGSYSSQSVIRKTESTVNGRIILKDTNNSSEDFDFLPLANPRGFKQ